MTPSRLAATLLALLVAAAASLALASPASAGTADDEARLFELHNQARAQHGLPAFQYDAAASGVARAWAQELARSGQLRHNPNVREQVEAHVTRAWTRLGENVGYSSNVDQVHGAYMDSAPHRANILGDFNRAGVGAARGADGRLWTTVVFLKAPALQNAAPPAPTPTVPASTFAPLPSAQAFAAQQFTDILGRPADAAGLMTWTNALSTGAVSPAAMVAALIDSPEAGMIVEPVNRLYRAYFRRLPDAPGTHYWIWRVRGGTSLSQISWGFADSAEFRATYGALSDAAFVDLVYRNVLGRPADAAGAGYWVSMLAAGRLDRGGVMVNFSESPEFKAGTRVWNDVVQVFVGMLRRSPSQNELDLWVTALRNGRPLTDLISNVLASPEYHARF